MATATKPKPKETAKEKDAFQRLLDLISELRAKARDEAADWEKSLEKVGDDALLEIGRLAIRAQRTPMALTALSAEIRKRKVELT